MYQSRLALRQSRLALRQLRLVNFASKLGYFKQSRKHGLLCTIFKEHGD